MKRSNILMRHFAPAIFVGSLGLSACGGGGVETVTARGRLTEESAGSERVEVVRADDSTTLIASAEIAADGRYQLALPSGERNLICRAVSSSGQVVASAIIEVTSESDSEIVIPPLDTETSVEAEVLVASDAKAEAIDLRARIDQELAAAIKSNAGAETRAIAEAVIAAQRAEARAFAEAGAGAETAEEARFDAELAAAARLNAALDGGAMNKAEAEAAFRAELDAAIDALGVAVQDRRLAESCAGLSFRTVAQAQIQNNAVLEAAILAAAELEARSSAAAVEMILRAGGASETAIEAAAEAGATLRAQVATAADARVAAQAFEDYSAELSGEVLAIYLDTNVATELALQTVIAASAAARVTLEGALQAAGSDVEAILDAYAAYEAAIDAQATALIAFGAKAQPALEVLAAADSSFRLGN